MNLPTRSVSNRAPLAVGTPSSNRAPTPQWSTLCPFCKTTIGLARGVPTTTICSTCGLRFTVDKAVRLSGPASSQPASHGVNRKDEEGPPTAPARMGSRWMRVLAEHPVAVGLVSLVTAASLLATAAIWARGF